MCYMDKGAILARLSETAHHADDLRVQARGLLVHAARDAAAQGLTQREIAEAMGRSQPEISRLLRFHGTSALARSVERNRSALLKRLAGAGAADVKVFGSVARGDDGPTSDLDLLATFSSPLSLFELAELEAELSEIVGAPVDLTSPEHLRAHLVERVLAEAVPI